MNIITLIKQVPDTAQLSSTVDGLKLMAAGGARIVNPWDEYAIETALQLKEAHGGKVTVLCLGPPEAVEALKTGLATTKFAPSPVCSHLPRARPIRWPLPRPRRVFP